MANDGIQVGFEAESGSKEYFRNQRHPQKNGHALNFTAEPPLPQRKSNLKPQCDRARHPTTNWAAGGPGMQAIFLDSSQKSCGTGVFLPRRAGADFRATTKPACSPVLLPSRVVQALKLNVHELGMQIKPPRDRNLNQSKSVNSNNAMSNKKGKDREEGGGGARYSCVASRSRSTSSPEIFLPKEWTY